MYPLVMGIQICSIKGPGPLQRGDNCKKGVGSFKNLILMNYDARKFYMKAFLTLSLPALLRDF
jgi:hypothetical protein